MMQVEACILRKNIQISIINANNIIPFTLKALKNSFKINQPALAIA